MLVNMLSVNLWFQRDAATTFQRVRAPFKRWNLLSLQEKFHSLKSGKENCRDVKTLDLCMAIWTQSMKK